MKTRRGLKKMPGRTRAPIPGGQNGDKRTSTKIAPSPTRLMQGCAANSSKEKNNFQLRKRRGRSASTDNSTEERTERPKKKQKSDSSKVSGIKGDMKPPDDVAPLRSRRQVRGSTDCYVALDSLEHQERRLFRSSNTSAGCESSSNASSASTSKTPYKAGKKLVIKGSSTAVQKSSRTLRNWPLTESLDKSCDLRRDARKSGSESVKSNTPRNRRPRVADQISISSEEESEVDSFEEELETEKESVLSSGHEESDSVPEVISMSVLKTDTASSSKSPALKLANKIKQLEAMLVTIQQKYEQKILNKEEDISRLKNELRWKDEQLEEMNQLVEKNMEMEAKIKFILNDKEAYDKEVLMRKEEEYKLLIEAEDGKKVTKKEEDKNTSDLLVKDSKTRKDKKQDNMGKSTTIRRSTRERKTQGKGPPKEESDEGDDIDALFVSSDDTDDEIDMLVDEEDAKNKSSSKDPKTQEEKPDDDESENPSQGDKSKIDMEEEDEDSEKKKHEGRKAIRKVMTGKKLTEETKLAARNEKERRDRAKKEHDKHIIVTETDPKSKLLVTSKIVLACKEGSKTPLVEVNSKLCRKLKPHQVEALEFVWDSTIESMDKLTNRDEGSGCILAHCMGLGKSLSLISFTHTLLCNKACKDQFKTCLIVCPLNTVLNWKFEWQKWLDKKDRLTVYELASEKGNADRIQLLNKWTKSGGVMIMGYQLFRILATYSGKSKKTKKAFDESLIDPGPDLVICDEGHVLKNDTSGISKCMNKIRTKRRVILTGTPLQNNLIEYHCMVNFVKPNLLGNRREFCNRFGNPITNGQHSDSTIHDVKVMKRRSHILHELLSGCVQRRDYTCLTKFLPPKYEYVISVRLCKLQMTLYEEYLKMNNPTDSSNKGTSLFSDYQCLMRIWTHPWVLKLDEIRQEKKGYSSDQDDELESFLNDSDYDEEDDDEEEIEIDSYTESEGEGEMTNGDVEEEGKDPSSDCEEIKYLPRKLRGSSTSADSKQKDSSDSTKTEENQKRSKNGGKQKRKTSQNGKDGSDREVSLEPGTSQSETSGNNNQRSERRAKIIAGEVIKSWKSSTRHKKENSDSEDELKIIKEEMWWHKHLTEEMQTQMELSGKLVLLFEILRMSETIGDKVLVFSQSLLSLDLIEDFLKLKNEEAEKENEKIKKNSAKRSLWLKDEDYLRMDGSTGAQTRNRFTQDFSNAKNKRLRLFLISTRAGGLGINLDTANRVIIFDASWNPSHDIQSIFRAYRFGQEKNVYIYRFLAQGTMEDKIYTRQVTKETLAQRVIDEHQIDRHFSTSDLQELYNFTPDRLDDPDRKEKTPPLPKDVVLAELMSSHREWIVDYHEHDSLLENRPEENLSEEEIKAAWEDYEREKQGIFQYRPNSYTSNPNYNNRAASTSTAGLSGVNQLTMPRLPLISQLGTASSNVPTFTSPQQKFSFQITQLPRVVQEILKYNPNIAAEELQQRLQAFLGMHNKQTIPTYGMISQGPTSAAVSQAPSHNPRLTLVSGAHAVPAQFMPFSIPGLNLPSRLPQPGRVPGTGATNTNT